MANANQVVIARINGEWYGGAWEALTRPYRDTGACRVMEAAKKKEAGHGPFAQVERDPFWTWFPEAGDWVGFMLTTWVRNFEIPNGPTGRSEVAWTKWPEGIKKW